MPKYYLLLTGEADYAPLSPAEGEATLKAFMDWSGSLAAEGRLLAAERLSNEEFKILRPGANPLSTDGPYAESKEAIGGYFAITAADVEEAAKIASGCPHLQHGGSIQVRGVYAVPADMDCPEAQTANA